MPTELTTDCWLSLTDIAEALFEQGFIDAAQSKALHDLASSSPSGVHPLEAIAQQRIPDNSCPGHCLEIEPLTVWLAQQAGMPYLRIDPLNIEVKAVAQLMSYRFARHHGILAVEADERQVTIACAQPQVRSWETDLAKATGLKIRRVIANPQDIRRYTDEFFRLAESVTGARRPLSSAAPANLERLLDMTPDTACAQAEDAPVIKIVDWLLQYAFEQRASDIHLEPRREHGGVRLRIDGLLHKVYDFPLTVCVAMVSRLKSLGRMNVAEKRKPQDGRIKTRTPLGREVELRLSTLPTAFGEKLVMRIFDPEVLLRSFDELGLAAVDRRRWCGMTAQAHGIVLVTGPTGSGKTTTLYTTLKQLATPEVNVCTIEDPIEMVEPAFNQMQVQHNIQLGFAEAIRALMRQDPDIIMIGEIRDLETAEMAVQAALTGHLVLATLHTNDAPSAVSRLLELGVPYYLLKATLLGVLAQRLVRTLCAQCKISGTLSPALWRALSSPWKLQAPATVQVPVGCPYCRDTGFRGRAGVYEILVMSEALKEQLNAETDIARLRRLAISEGMRTLRLAGALKVAAGLTTGEEVLRVTP